MALNIPMPESPGTSLLQGLDTGSALMSRMMQPILERERLKQQQAQFIQDFAIKKQQQDKANALLPYMIQEYQDTHRTAEGEQKFKDFYRNIIEGAMSPDGGTQMGGGQQGQGYKPTPQEQQAISQMQPGQSIVLGQGVLAGANKSNPGIMNTNEMPQGIDSQEHELRAGNPRLSKLDAIAGLVPGIPKPAQHIQNGMIFTNYPSGRMTIQKVGGSAGQTPGERNVSAKEASKIRDQASALVNSANLVNQGYGILKSNPDLTGPGSGLAAKFKLSNNPELGKFTTVAGKLQAELGKYASSRGGIQAVNWAGNIKPSSWNPEDYNYGMFEGIQQNLQDDYNTLNEQYKAATGENLPVALPKMQSPRGKKIKIRNKKTGEVRLVTEAEAKSMGVG